SNVTTIVGGSGNDEFHVSNDHTANLDFTAGAGNVTLVVKTGTALTISFQAGTGNADTIVNEQGNAGGVDDTGVETLIDRPLLFIPGFGGTFANTDLAPSADLKGDTALEEWLLNRGISPDRLVLEPLMEAYSDIVATLDNMGYVDGTNQAGVNGTLYTVLWDYRVPVATPDADPAADNNGVLDSVDAESLIDDSFDTALDYVSFFLKIAATAWQNLTGTAPDSVDIITHSTGGLVAKSYIQSAAYTEDKDGTLANLIDGTTDHLLPVNLLIQTGVPNQGTGAPFALLNNDFSLKSATRLLAKILKDVYALHESGKTVLNPDKSELTATSEADFIGKYVATFFDLMATYDFLDDATGSLASLLPGTPFFNNLLAELNERSVDDFVSRGGEQLETLADNLPIQIYTADVDSGSGNNDGIVTYQELTGFYGGAGNSNLLEVGVDSLPGELSVADTGDDAGGAPDGIVSFDELIRYYDLGTYIVFSSAVDTADFAYRQTGPIQSLGLKNELLRFNSSTLVGTLP
ncbi:MAG: hypothetical protein JJ992_27025, partial [Planctomycetes bacterium]|nr:hypothetical protein [Planctomycetota bacterium]